VCFCVCVQEQFSILIKFMQSWKNTVALWGVTLVNPLSFLFVTCLLTEMLGVVLGTVILLYRPCIYGKNL